MNKTKHLTKLISLIFAFVMLSSVMVISASAVTALKAPSKVSATQTTSSITLSWSKVSGATGYRIYYKFPRDLHWKTAVSSTTATSKTWKNLPSGETYIFAVKGYKKSGNTTTWGKYKEFTTSTKPVVPKKIVATQTEDSIKLKWSDVKGATGYRVYYKTSADTKWKTMTSSIDDNTVTYSNLKSAKKYTFAVKPYIKTSSGVIWGAYKEIGTATKPATPKKLTAEADSYGKTITLSWNKVSGADGYQIYRREHGEEAWRVAVNSTSGTSYTFKKVAEGGWEYAVMAIVKTSSGTVCGYYRCVYCHMYMPTTAMPTTTRPSTTRPSTTSPTTTRPTTTPPTTTTQPTTKAEPEAVCVSISEVGVDSQGRIFASIDSDGWDGAIKSNSQRVSVYVDGVEMKEQAMLQISSSTTGDGYQYVYIDLGKYDIDPSNCTITFEIPEGFLENRNGTKYNLACEVTM